MIEMSPDVIGWIATIRIAGFLGAAVAAARWSWGR
jgi:hypothetical protein